MSTKNKILAGRAVVTADQKETRSDICRPPMYSVFLVNDDYTSMDFVVNVLMQFFALNEPAATMLMLKVHKNGRGNCGIFTRDIAETKVMLVNNYSRANQQPLLCQMEKT